MDGEGASREALTAEEQLATFERRLLHLRKRLVREGTEAVAMLEGALAALWALDEKAAMNVRLRDDSIDNEEVAIEQECYELLALRHPFAHDFRFLTFSLRANADLERVGDHASSIAKIVKRIKPHLPGGMPPPWPTALQDLGRRVPALCHELLRSMLDEDAEAARALVNADQVIDQLERRVFEEVQEVVRLLGRDDKAIAVGMLIYRAGRELERIGDLMAAIAEDVVYLKTGEIIRHAKRRQRSNAAQ